tara:strand:+ start:342 stop:524 length:183 start_codon:yes stop_codon:yes gene_type:complete
MVAGTIGVIVIFKGVFTVDFHFFGLTAEKDVEAGFVTEGVALGRVIIKQEGFLFVRGAWL